MDYIQMYLDEKSLGKSPETIRNYKHGCRSFEKWFNQPVEHATKPDILKYIGYLKGKNLKKSSIETAFIQLTTFYEWMRDETFITANPCTKISAPKADKTDPVYLTPEEMDKLLEVSSVNQRDDLIVKMLYSTGARVSELIKIKKKDIDFATGKIRVFGKGSKERIVLLHPAYLEQFKEYVKAFDKDQVLFPLDKGTVEKDIKRMAKMAGIDKHVTPHKLRHSFATHLFRETKDIVLVQGLLGHSSIQTTQIYTHIDMEDVIEGHSKLTAARSKN